MKVLDIVYIGIAVIVFIVAFVTTIISFYKKRKTNNATQEGELKQTTTNSVKEFYELFKTNLQNIIGYVTGAEKFYNSITTGKVGSYKLENVLQKIQLDCLNRGEEFDKDYWTNIVDNIVSVMNINK